jgi:hypothetical protein
MKASITINFRLRQVFGRRNVGSRTEMTCDVVEHVLPGD